MVQNGSGKHPCTQTAVWTSSSALYEETPIKCIEAEEFRVGGLYHNIQPILLQLVFKTILFSVKKYVVKKGFIKELQDLACREKKKVIPVSWEKLYVERVSSIVYFKSKAISKSGREKVKLENV